MENKGKFIFLVFISSVSANIQYRVGGLFSESVNQVAFQVVVNDLNKENWEQPFEIITDPFNVSYYNSFEARKAACSLLEKGVIGIFGPSSTYTSNYIQSICDNKEIPHIETHYDSKIQRNRFVVNLHPHPSEITQFFVHLVCAYEWSRVIILFEDNESLLRLAPILELNIQYKIHLIFRQLDKDSFGSYREVLNSIKKMQDNNILLDCSIDNLEEVLRQAQQIGIMTDNYKYIITNLDLGIIDLEPFQYGGANITGIRLFDPENEKVTTFKTKILESMEKQKERKTEWKMRLSTVLLIDGVHLFYEVIKDFLGIHNNIAVESLRCKNTESWRYGYTIANQLKSKEYHGLTRKISFDNEGFRKDFLLDIMELNREGFVKIGEWNTTLKVLNFERKYVPPLDIEEEDFNIFNRTFRVVIALTQPYAMLKETTDQLMGNDRFEGFCIDVIQELSSILGFNYTFIVQADGKNGNLNRNTNEWDGVIRQIIDDNADLAITDLTITSERENAVDFTMPFMNLGISILYRKPTPEPPSLFMFTSPFSTSVWIMLGVAYMLVSISFFIMGRLSPSEWNNPFPCVEEPEYLINQFSIRNSLWFTIGGLLQQGSELAPISISARTASGVWWFFVLIMVSSYTANLAAFLTVETLVAPFKSIDDLAKQTKIKFGAKKGGATESFFKDSNISNHQRVYQYLRDHPEVMTAENEEGVERVENENYAYLMESTSIEYTTQRHCSLAQIGGLLDDKGYGIAMKRYSPYRNDLSTAILKLQETGRLTHFKIKWWKEKRGGSACAAKSEEPEAEALDLQNVGGVFLVLFVGAVLALVGSFLEMASTICRKCKRTNTPFMHELKKELSFFIQFSQNEKEVS
nr:glutamate receptor ionotropic 5 [Pachyrhinus yasumatsui]